MLWAKYNHDSASCDYIGWWLVKMSSGNPDLRPFQTAVGKQQLLLTPDISLLCIQRRHSHDEISAAAKTQSSGCSYPHWLLFQFDYVKL